MLRLQLLRPGVEGSVWGEGLGMDGNMAYASVDVCLPGKFILRILYIQQDGNMACQCRRLFTREISFYTQQDRNMACQCIPRKLNFKIKFPWYTLACHFHFTHNVYNRMGIWHASVDVFLPRKYHFTHTVYNRMGLTWHARVHVYQGNFILPTTRSEQGMPV